MRVGIRRTTAPVRHNAQLAATNPPVPRHRRPSYGSATSVGPTQQEDRRWVTESLRNFAASAIRCFASDPITAVSARPESMLTPDAERTNLRPRASARGSAGGTTTTPIRA